MSEPTTNLRRSVLHIHPYDMYARINRSKSVTYPNEYIQLTHAGKDGARWTSFSEVILIDGAGYVSDTDAVPQTIDAKAMCSDDRAAL